MRVDIYRLLTHAVEEGVGYGLRGYNKHRAEPLSEEVVAALVDMLPDAVMGAICDWFLFEDLP